MVGVWATRQQWLDLRGVNRRANPTCIEGAEDTTIEATPVELNDSIDGVLDITVVLTIRIYLDRIRPCSNACNTVA